MDQLKESIPTLNILRADNILFLMNMPEETAELNNQFPGKNIFLGFPGVGGVRINNTIEYVQIKQQKTSIGNTERSTTQVLKNIKSILIKSGFPTVIEPTMQDWLIVHSVFISCVSAAIVKENGNSVQLGTNKESVKLMVRSIKQGFTACQRQGIAIVPKNIKTIFIIMPEWFSVLYWQKALKGIVGRFAIEPHARVAEDEMKMMANQVLQIVYNSGIRTRYIHNLLEDFSRM